MEAGREKIPTAELVVIVDLPADLLRRRPDVRAAEMRLAAQSAQIGVSEAALYPRSRWSARSASPPHRSTGRREPFNGASARSLVWNIFDWGRLKNRCWSRMHASQLYEQYQDTVLRAARELDDAATDFAQARAQVDILREAVQAARRSLDIATIQYREGLVGFERVLDSQRSLFSQQERLVSTGGVTQSLIAVYKAMGGGWQAARAEPVVDESTRAAMSERSAWKGLLDAPLPPPRPNSAHPNRQKRHEQGNRRQRRPGGGRPHRCDHRRADPRQPAALLHR